MDLWGELKRRNVVRVAIAYAVVAWLVLQVADVLFPALQLPEWTITFVAALLVLGLPIALVLSWVYELTPDGFKKTLAVIPSQSITSGTGRKIDFVIISVLVVAVVFMFVDNYRPESGPFAGADINPSSPVPTLEQPARLQPDQESRNVIPNSVAVLVCENLSPDPEDAYFAASIHLEILGQLRKLRNLTPIARGSVLQYSNETPPAQIADELRAETVMRCSVRYAGDDILVAAELIDPETNLVVWDGNYPGSLTDVAGVFAMQADIATAIARELEASLSPEEIVRLAAIPTQNTRAYDFYLRGNDYFSRPNDRAFMPDAVQMYSRAVGEDPNFALAWAALSRAHSNMHWYAVDRSPRRLELAWEAAQRALDIDPDLPEAHLALGSYYDHGFFDYEQAQREFAIVEEAIPGDPELLETMAYMLRRMNNPAEALMRLERLLDRDPRNPDLLMQLGITSRHLQQYDRAADYFDRALELAPDDAASHSQKAYLPWFRDGDVSEMAALAENPPTPLGEMRDWLGWYAALYERDYAAALEYIDRIETNGISNQIEYLPKPLLYGWVYWLSGRDDIAEPEFRQAITLAEEGLAMNSADARMHIALAQAYAGLGDREAAVRVARDALDLVPRSRNHPLGGSYQLNVIKGVFAPLNDVETTVNELDNHLAAGSYWRIEGLLPDPRLDPVRDDPRFQALVEKYRRR